MAKILCVCEYGLNRSVTLAHQLKFLGHDVIPIGVLNSSPETLEMLTDWADHVITTDSTQEELLPPSDKLRLWYVGPDVFPRPFNKDLLRVVKLLVQEHRHELEDDVVSVKNVRSVD